MPLTPFQVHRFWLIRMALVLVLTCLIDALAVYVSARPLIWAALIPATLPLSIYFFVAMPVYKQVEPNSQIEDSTQA